MRAIERIKQVAGNGAHTTGRCFCLIRSQECELISASLK
jgi:hypothetical protein